MRKLLRRIVTICCVRIALVVLDAARLARGCVQLGFEGKPGRLSYLTSPVLPNILGAASAPDPDKIK